METFLAHFLYIIWFYLQLHYSLGADISWAKTKWINVTRYINMSDQKGTHFLFIWSGRLRIVTWKSNLWLLKRMLLLATPGKLYFSLCIYFAINNIDINYTILRNISLPLHLFSHLSWFSSRNPSIQSKFCYFDLPAALCQPLYVSFN